jgi:hypothetical protein
VTIVDVNARRNSPYAFAISAALPSGRHEASLMVVDTRSLLYFDPCTVAAVAMATIRLTAAMVLASSAKGADDFDLRLD